MDGLVFISVPDLGCRTRKNENGGSHAEIFILSAALFRVVDDERKTLRNTRLALN